MRRKAGLLAGTFITTFTGSARRGNSAILSGLLPTTAAAMGLTPTVQYHPNTATVVMRANGTFQGYISGTLLTVTTWATATAQTLRQGVQIIAGASGTTTILKSVTATGGTGNYRVDISQTVGSSGSPVTFTTQSQEISSVSDNMGNAALSIATPGSTPDATGPALLTDALGRQFLRFRGAATVSSWLRSITLAGLDSANMTWFMSGRIYAQNPNSITYPSGTIISTGTREAANYSSNVPCNLGFVAAMASMGNYNIPQNYSAASNISKMFLGEQMQVVGSVIATTDGLNGASTLTTTAANRCIQIWLNEQAITLTTSPFGSNRMINTTGFTVGQIASSGTLYGYFDLYELVGFLTGQLGAAMASVPVKAAQISSALMTNWAIVPITKSLVLMGDSRTAYGEGGGAGLSNDGSEYSIGSLLGEPGSPYCVPNGTRIFNMGAPGYGIARNRAQIDKTADYFGNTPVPTAASLMLGGGNDYAAMFMGVNDVGIVGGGAVSQWPTTQGGGGTNAPGSLALGDELYNGAGYAITATITNSANANTGTFVAGTGTVYAGARLTSAGFSPGQYVQSVSGTTITFGQYEPTAHSSVSATLRIDSYLSFVQTLIARGLKVLVAVEPHQTTTGVPAQMELSSRILTNMVTDAGGSNIYTTDLRAIQVGATYPFGANYEGLSTPGPNFVDLVHFTRVGKINLLGGGATPSLGYGAAISGLLAR